jgi:hypothetical protein
MPKPEEHKGMPQYRHCAPANHREHRNPEYYEEQQKDLAGILAAHPSLSDTVEREHALTDVCVF